MILGLSGSRNGDRGPYRGPAMSWLSSLGGYDGYVTGACVGFDTLAGTLLLWLFPAAMHRVIVPADRSRVDYWFLRYPQVVVQYMEEGTTYADRNQRLVDVSHELAAAPEYAELHKRSLRSGTWQTVRKARRKPIPVLDPFILSEWAA